jgi:hypothetical protein
MQTNKHTRATQRSTALSRINDRNSIIATPTNRSRDARPMQLQTNWKQWLVFG